MRALTRFIIVACGLTSSLAWPWGFDGHRKLASLMQEPLPANSCLRAWYKSKQSYTLQNSACDPDRWRDTSSPNYDPNEAPRHFLEIDWATPIASYPRDFSQAVAKFGQKNATDNGLVPWRVEDMYAQLVAAFRAKNEADILSISFVMSHYVNDSFSVLHDTKNYNPNFGLHSRWESDMLQPTANINAIASLAATYYGTPGRVDPRNNTFDVVTAGNPLVADLIAADLAACDGGTYDASTYDLPTLFRESKDLTARRWGDALTLMSSMLWSAWAEAGSPELSGFVTGCTRDVPTGEIIFVGYPPAGGFTHDAGFWGDGGATRVDGGQPVDAGGSVDAGPSDAGASTDAGQPLNDAGPTVDAGQPPSDGGTQADAGGGGGTGGGGGSGGGTGGGAGGGGGNDMPAGCSCTHLSGPLMLVALAVLFARRRRAA